MATAAYYAWVRAGRPWTVMRPAKALGDRLRAYGYTVYFLGADDTSHLQAARPEDHCPFSATGWPGNHPYPYVAALDIMPPRTGSGLPSLQQLGARIVADRNAGVSGIGWLKYINHEPDRDNGGACWHHSWQPTYARVSSSDRGHIHISARSDVATSAIGDTYDPVARIRNESGTTSTPGDDMYENDDRAWDRAAQWRIRDIALLAPTFSDGPEKGQPIPIVKAITDLTSAVAGLKTGPAANVDAGQVAAALAGSAPFLAAIAKAVADENARRQQA